MPKLQITLFVSLFICLSSCYYDNEEDLYPGGIKCDTVGVSFNQDIFPIIQGNCNTVGCHVAGGAGNGIFENYLSVKAKVDNGSFENRVLVLKNMPPSQPLNQCQLAQIQIWIDAGAPNN